MLCLYRYILIIGHNSCKMLSILNKLTVQKKFQNCVTNNVFLNKKVNTQQQQNKISNIKTVAGAGNWTRDLSHPKRMRYLCTTESTESNDCYTVVKLINSFEAMVRNVNKQNRIWGQHIFNKFIFFSNTFTCMDNYIWQFLIFTGVGFAA